MDSQALAGEFGFELDPYQLEAVGHLEAGMSVLVSAPTGSGKTVVAEYALSMCRAAGTKFFYTTPLKALSNQKFRDLARVYPQGDVGLLTGDNSINAEATVVVMTTEVLRNMIYEKSDLLSGLGVVVLDEVHYMHDPYRGAVWEEIVIMLDKNVRLVALSATVSNADAVAGWMDSLRGDVRVVYSDSRPVKLRDYYFVGNKLVGLFSKNLQRIISDQLERAKRPPARGARHRKKLDLRPRRVPVLKELAKKEMLPAIYFLFSRAACDDSASMWLSEGSRLTSKVESDRIEAYLDEKTSVLSASDLECLDYGVVRRAMTRGVAVHHAGVLPLFKEAIEELFTAGLVKVVFATETLSLGINMPARTVVIESLVKWGGDRHRPLTSGEYKQLTGRAGRRGIDDVGHAVILYQRQFSFDQIRGLVTREPSPVVSSFEVSYNMAANIMADRTLAGAKKILNLSFAQYVSDRRVVELEARVGSLRQELDAELAGSSCPEGGDATTYRDLERRISRESRRLSKVERQRRKRQADDAVAKLKPGDVVFLGERQAPSIAAFLKRRGSKKSGSWLQVVDTGGTYRKVPVDSLEEVPEVLGTIDVQKLGSPKKKVRKQAVARIESAEPPGGVKRGGEGPEEKKLRGVIEQIKVDREGHPCHRCKHRQRCLEAARRADRTSKKIRSDLKKQESARDVVSRRLEDVAGLLQENGFMRGDELTRKGQLLRRIYNECDLLLVEALERGLLKRLSPRELCAFASWFIYESRDGETESERALMRVEQDHLEGAPGDVLEELDAIMSRLKEHEALRGLDLLGSLDTGFSEEVYMWSGETGLEDMLSRYPEMSVGDMVRLIKQIIDLLRQLSDVTDDPGLRKKLSRSMGLLDRGVVGYSSLESIIEHESESGTADLDRD
jgi:ATP-dependent RNA helicase HelY